MRGLVSSVVLLCVAVAVAHSQAPRRDIVVPPPHWNRIVGKPTTFPPGVHTQDWSSITGTPTTVEGYGITNAFDGSYTNLTDVPATFPPSAHQHNYTDITNVPWKTEAELDALYLSITNNFLDASTITNLLDAKEDALGNPGVDDYVLSSKTDGTRSWVENAGGGGGGGLTNSNGDAITVASTNETSTSETEVMTAGAVARGRLETIELAMQQTSAQTVATAFNTQINFHTNATAFLATTAAYTNSVDLTNNRIYFPKIGRWRITGGLRLLSAPDKTSYMLVRYVKHGSSAVQAGYIQTDNDATFQNVVTITLRNTTTNDYVYLDGYQASGSNSDTAAGQTYLYAIWEGY